jgi:cysteine desulfuration protein SufE
MLIEEKINKIKDDFSFFENWEDKYQYLIDLGKKLPDLKDIYKKDEFRVQGCTSNLWVVPQFNDDKLTFLGSSDSVIVQGLFYLVKYVYDNEYPKTIINKPLDFFDEIGLSSHLGPSRANGLNSLKKLINSIATELQKN